MSTSVDDPNPSGATGVHGASGGNATNQAAALLLHGGRLYDAEANAFMPGDLLIEHGKIRALGRIEPAMSSGAAGVDVAGCYVAPGFIDAHVHVFSHPLFATSRLAADRIGVEHGVTCVVDAGSSGATTIDAFPQFVHQTQHTRVYAFINIGSPGLPNLGGGHSSRPELLDLPGVVKAFERHGDWLLGVKVLASASHTGAFGEQAVKMARKAAEVVGRPLMLHIGNAPPVVDDVLNLLRPGDIVTHAYHGKVGGALTYQDRVLPAFAEAVKRGVWVDIAHGRASFSFDTCAKAMAQGMPVHSISSDLHAGNLNRYVVSLPRTMSKMLTLGLSLEDVTRAVSVTPAKMLGLSAKGFGALTVGQPAHVSVFKLQSREVEVEDAEGIRRTTRQWIEPTQCLVHGRSFTTSAPL